MKRIRILFTVCIALCFLSVYSYGQSTSEKATEPMYFGYECDGVFDLLQGELTWHNINHFSPQGMWKWNNWQVHSNGMVSITTGEVFNMNYKDKMKAKNKMMNILEETVHYNLVGDRGTHLIYSVKWQIDMSTGLWTKVDEKIMCE